MNSEKNEAKKPRGNPHIAELGRSTQFKPGQSGNPGGRPSWTPYADAYREVAELQVADLVILPTDLVAVATAKAVASQSLKGNVGAAAEAANRAEGTPRQRPELAKEVVVVVKYEKPPSISGNCRKPTDLRPHSDDDSEPE